LIRHNYTNLEIRQVGLEMINDVLHVIIDFLKHQRFNFSSELSKCSI
jgi:hypothetical protein